MREFQNMKVVTPAWLVESANAGVLLPWQEYKFRPGERAEDAQGRPAPQKSILDGFATQNAPSTPGLNRPRATPRTRQLYGPTERLATTSVIATVPKAELPTPVDRPPIPQPDPTVPPKPGPSRPNPPWAKNSSNVAAARAMNSVQWRGEHTSAAGAKFIDGYYASSRLHHLSTWKSELRWLVSEAQKHAEEAGGDFIVDEEDVTTMDIDATTFEQGGVSMRGAELVVRSPGKGKGKAREHDRVIMHCDFDAFFVSAGLVDRPELKGKPVVVCHSQDGQGGASSTSEIASSSYEARKYGIKNGMSLQQGRTLCPDIMTIPYEFEKYKKISLTFYTILMSHADDLQAVSVDEALIEVTSIISRMTTQGDDPAKRYAELLRKKVKLATGCEVSIGIAHNIMLARLATRRAKPAGSYHLLPVAVPEFIAPLHIQDLHGFGHAARDKAQEKLGTTSLAELLKRSRASLCDALGPKTGEMLWNAIRGIDERVLESDKPRKSVSCEINYGIRFEDNDQVEKFMYQLADEVAKRLDGVKMRGRSLTLKIMKRSSDAPVEPAKFLGHGPCDTFNKQCVLAAPRGEATSNRTIIGAHAWRLLKTMTIPPEELRGIGIQITKLESTEASAEASHGGGQGLLTFKSNAGKSDGQTGDRGDTADGVGQQDEAAEVFNENLPPAHTGLESGRRELPESETLDIPSFSQVDMSVFEALPPDVRQELEEEYKRRSATPFPKPEPPPPPPPSPPKQESRASTKSPVKRGRHTVSHITRQLAPRSRASISPRKHGLFRKRPPPIPKRPIKINVTEEELAKLGIDAVIFAMLPPDIQQEQLNGARYAKKFGVEELDVTAPKKVLKPPIHFVPYHKRAVMPPRPTANYIPRPKLMQQVAPHEYHPDDDNEIQEIDGATGKVIRKSNKVAYTETGDVQRVIETWLSRFGERIPNAKDVEFFAKFLVRCVDGAGSGMPDTGVERAIGVMRWWLVLLRRRWGKLEHARDTEDQQHVGAGDSEDVGKAWWKVFRDVKGKMDIVARKKFGGSLAIR
ncbi:hypothetical protein BD410DRAFT_103283 [Rickenella mellea]|uniref:DNA repair protein REV1 n=1 Tax=Rickenella mellea TaxID=50990 RepID=A0A4Y7PMD6_9AGAM|nr:hypothetical protein BD410DRAFT_103283 [Rickenella mellea]